MDVDAEIENFAENKVYEGIFNIFELELEEISRFVAFTSGNMNTYSNKIHELHLRVCSEIENVLKIVVHKHFVSAEEVKTLWDTDKSAFLEKKSLTPKYEELKNELNSGSKKDVDRLLFGFPDLAFYFKIACDKFNLHKKVIKFTGMVSHNIDWEVIQPFEIKKGEKVPVWWTHYNNLKHDKIKNYNICTLDDLIKSMSGLYILMNYLLKYQENNPPIQNQNYDLDKIKESVVPIGCEFCFVQTKFFSASNAHQNIIFFLILPSALSEEEYQTVRISDLLKSFTFQFEMIKEHENEQVKDMDLKSFRYKWLAQANNKNDLLNSVEHALFYTYLDYAQFINLQQQNFRKLKQFGRFIN